MNKRRILLAALIALTSGIAQAQQDGTWTNTAGGNWTDPLNWDLNTIADGSGFTANFSTINPTGDVTVALNGNRTIGNLIFGDTDTSSAAGWTVTGNTLTLAGTTPTITVGALGTGKVATISSIIDGTSGLKKDGAGTLVLTGVNIYTGGTTVTDGTLQLGNGTINPTIGTGAYSVASGATLRVRYNTAGVTGSPTFSTVTGAGTLALATGKNFDFGWGAPALTAGFTGTLQIEGGRVAPAAVSGLGGTTNINILNGGQLALYSIGNNTLSQNFTIAGTGYGEGGFESAIRLANGGQSTTLSGTIALSASATVAATGTSTLSGVISGGAGANLTFGTGGQAGTVILTNSNNYAGNTIIAAGTLQLGNGGATGSLATTGTITNNGTLAINRNNAVTQGTDFSGAAITGTGGFTKAGTGTTTLNAANTFSGNTAVSAGSLNLSHSLALQNSTVTTGGTGIVFDSSVGSNAFTFGGLAGSTNLALVNNAGSPNAVALTVGGNNSTNTYSAALSGAGSLTKSGTGALTLSGVNTYAGGTTLTGGTLLFPKLTSMPATGTVAMGTGTSMIVNVGGPGEWTTGTSGVGTMGGLFAGLGGQGSSTVTYTGAVGLGFDTTNAASTQTYSGNIPNLGTSLGLTKLGAGTLILDGVNSYTGTNTISGGVLQVGTGGTTGNLSATGAVTIASGANLTINRSDNIALANSVTGAGSFTHAGTGTTTITASGNSGVITNFNPTGGVNVNAGTLKLNLAAVSNTASLNMGTYNIAAGATLEMNVPTGTGTVLTNTGTVFTGAGTINITAGTACVDFWSNGIGTSIKNFTGQINIISGTLASQTTNDWGVSAGAMSVQINSGAWFDLRTDSPRINNLTGSGIIGSSYSAQTLTVGAQNGSSTFSGLIQNTVPFAFQNNGQTISLTKVGTGTLTLNGANAFTNTGATTVNNGTLLVDFANRATPTNLLTATSALNLSGGKLSILGKNAVAATSQTLGNLTLAANTSSVIALDPNGGTSTNLTLNNAWTINSNAGLLIDLTAAGTSTITSSPTLTAGIINPNVVVTDAGGTGLATVVGGQVVRLTTGTVLTDVNSDGTTGAVNFTTTPTDPNYSGGILTLAAGTHTTNTLAISSGAGGTLDLNGTTLSLTANNLIMGGSGDYTIQNGTVGDSGSALTVNQTGSGKLTIYGTVTGGAGSLIKVGQGNLVLTGANAYTGGTTIAGGTLTIGGASQLAGGTYAGAIVNNGTLQYSSSAAQTLSGAISGTGALIKDTGAGTLTLSGANTFTGIVDISAGNVTSSALPGGATSFLGGPGTAGNRRVVNIGAGTQVSYTNTTANGFLNLGAVVANGGYGSFYDFNITGTLAINDGGAVSQILQSTYNLNNGGIITNTGTAHTGGYGLLFGWSGAGGGNINVTGTGNQITADRIGFFNGATITTNPGAALTISSIIKDGTGAAASLIKAGDGTLILTGANTYTGGTTITGGTLRVDLTSRTGTINPLGTYNIGANGTLNLLNTNTGIDNTLLQNTIFSGSGTITKTGAGYLDFHTGSSFVNFTGNIDVQVGTLAINNLGTGASSGLMSLNIASGATFDLRHNSALTIDKLSGGGNMAVSFSAATLSIGNNNGSSSYGGVLQNGAGLALTKNGIGTQTLTGVNTYAGATNVNGGTLIVGGGGALNNSSSVTIAKGATLRLSGTGNNQLAAGVTNGTLTINGTLEATTNVAHTLSNGSTYFANIAMNNGTLNTTVANSTFWGAFFFNSSRTITATGTNTISGQGVIGILGGQVLTLSPTNVSDIINVTGTIGQGSSGTAGGITKAGLGTVTLSGANTYTGPTTISGGSLQIGNGGNTGSLSTSSTITNNANLTINRSDAVTQGTHFSGAAIGGSGSFTQAGSGTTTLTAVNTYGGITTVNAGQLIVQGSIANNGPASVLMATPDITLLNNPILTRRVANATNYATAYTNGLGSTAVSSDPDVLNASMNTTAAIIGGTTTGTSDISMQWRARTSGEADITNVNAVLSNVLNLNGVYDTGTIGDGILDTFVLQMSYTDAALGSLDETAIALSGELRLGWLDGGTWKSAFYGNNDGTGTGTFVGAFAYDPNNPNHNVLGAYGVDPANNVVWAVLNHNSEFAVIPEPSTFVVGGLALLGLAGVGLRRRRQPQE